MFDRRFYAAEFSPERYLTSERKDVSVDFVAIGLISDVADFYRATDAKEGEVPLFSWIEWPDRATADKAQAAMEQEMQDQPMPEMPFDGARMFWGGFAPVFDSDEEGEG